MSAPHLVRGSAGYRRATLALFCAGFATFAMLYCVQPLLPLLAAHFRVSAASSSLALSLTTLSLALCLLVSGALAESWGRKPVMAAALGLAALLGMACALVDEWSSLLLLRALHRAAALVIGLGIGTGGESGSGQYGGGEEGLGHGCSPLSLVVHSMALNAIGTSVAVADTIMHASAGWPSFPKSRHGTIRLEDMCRVACIA